MSRPGCELLGSYPKHQAWRNSSEPISPFWELSLQENRERERVDFIISRGQEPVIVTCKAEEKKVTNSTGWVRKTES